MTTGGFAAHEQTRLRAELTRALDDRYAKLYCRATDYTREETAACAYLDTKRAPAPARAVLRASFGGDEPFL
jgi:hypothetical protein